MRISRASVEIGNGDGIFVYSRSQNSGLCHIGKKASKGLVGIKKEVMALIVGGWHTRLGWYDDRNRLADRYLESGILGTRCPRCERGRWNPFGV